MTEKSQLIDREKVKAEEYEVQLFGFSIDEFIGDSKNVFNFLVLLYLLLYAQYYLTFSCR